jgi:predicted transcriptional regulator
MYRLNFETLEGVSTVAKETNLKLLQAIRQHDPSSIRDLADIVGRDYREVHRNLSELEELDIVTFEREGRSKKPVVRYDELRFEIPLVDTASDVDVSSPA